MVSGPTDASALGLLERLRGEVEFTTAGLAAPLAVMLYLRWADFHEAEAEAMAAFDGEVDFAPTLPAALHWRSWHLRPPEELNRFFSHALPEAVGELRPSFDRGALAGPLLRLLPAIRAVAELPGGVLAALAEWLAGQLFETPGDRRELLGRFDTLIDRIAGRDIGAIRTPPAVARLLVTLADPAPGERLYDPCFGTGGILTAACEAVRCEAVKHDAFARGLAPELVVTGGELDPDAFAIGLARTALAGATGAQLELGDSLERDGANSPGRDGCDLVVCNPPWSGRRESLGVDHFPVRTRDLSGLFVQHALSQLRPDGRAVLVVPRGFLSRGGPQAKLRRWLMEHHHVDSVVDVPGGAFLPYSGVSAAILILRRGGGPTRQIRMVEGSAVFSPAKGGRAAEIDAEGASALAMAVRDEAPGKLGWDVDGAAIAEIGFDLSPVRRESLALKRVLGALGPDVPVEALRDVCEIRGGTSVPSAQQCDRPAGDAPVPYLRISDVKDGQAGKTRAWIDPEAARRIASKKRLRAGQVVLSRSGSVGKVGVVRNGAVGGVATEGLFVLTPDSARLDPHFFAAYLSSSECKQWLQSGSTGSVVLRLGSRRIKELPVPVPPLPIQHRVAADVREHGVDALTQLGILINQRDDDPLARWVDRSLQVLEKNRDDGAADPSLLVRSQVFREGSRPLCDRAAQALDPSPLVGWAGHLGRLVDLFAGTEDLPAGLALLSLLQQGDAELVAADLLIEGNSPLELRAREIGRLCRERLARGIEALFADSRIEIKVMDEKLAAGARVDLAFVVRNRSALPLKQFSIQGEGVGSASKSIFLYESAERTLSIEVDAPREPGDFPIAVTWRGLALDGREHRGRQEVVLLVEPPDEAEEGEAFDIGLSPYFHNQPVGPGRADVFFGRERLLDQVKHQLQSGNVVLLEGNRRAGKSSILKHLEGSETVPGWLTVYCSFQAGSGDERRAGMTTETLWRTVAETIAKGVGPVLGGTPLPDGTTLPPDRIVGISGGCRKGIGSEAPWDDFREYLDLILARLAEAEQGLVLMIDEFDKLQEGIESGVTSPQAPENLRFLLQTKPRFTAVLTGARRMAQLRHEYWSALYGLGYRIGVSALDEASARRLVTEPVDGRLHFSGEAESLVVELTARQPFLIQYLCNRIFDSARALRQRSINAALVRAAAAAFVEDNEHFATLWGYAGGERRRYLVALCHEGEAGPDPVTFGYLQERMTRAGIEVPDDVLDGDLKALQDLELIEFSGAPAGSRFRLTVPLMGQWLEAFEPVEALRGKALAEQEMQL